MIGIKTAYYSGLVLLFLCHEEAYAGDVTNAIQRRGKPRHMKLQLGPFTEEDKKDAIADDRYVGSRERME